MDKMRIQRNRVKQMKAKQQLNNFFMFLNSIIMYYMFCGSWVTNGEIASFFQRCVKNRYIQLRFEHGN